MAHSGTPAESPTGEPADAPAGGPAGAPAGGPAGAPAGGPADTSAATSAGGPSAVSPEALVSSLSAAQKADLVTGATFWSTAAVPSAGVSSITVTDGPHGLRKQRASGDHLGLGASEPATCFPPAVGLGSSFDTELICEVGAAIGREARNQGVAVVLGPGLNIKRSPLCGRNFEYFSEDPLLAGEFAAAMTRGIQSQGVGASAKHFAANNQEHDRMRVSADIDGRTLREIYLRGFERVVATAEPWTIMCSYNRINGAYAAEDPWLLHEVLRREWAYQGLVISDWFAVGDRVASLQAGLDLEMPTTAGASQQRVLEALAEGELEQRHLDAAATRVVELVQRAERGTETPLPTADPAEHHALARRAAARSAVLLKNDDATLPLDRGASLAVIGEFARTPRYQGSGSSQINPTRLDACLDALRERTEAELRFAPGFTLDSTGDAASLRQEAVAAAAASDVAVVFLGLPDAAEAEGFDRTTIDLPAQQVELLDEVVAANAKTVVVLSNGGVVALPFAEKVPAILEGWLLGQAGGTALADILFGEVNPSGRLTETIPKRLQDSPSYLDFPGEHGHVRYGEGIFVGYRWYDAREIDVAFPFGHGLSYTSFEYSDLHVGTGTTGGSDSGTASSTGSGTDSDADAGPAADTGNGRAGVTVSVTVTNTGDFAAHEVVQAYVGLADSAVTRAPRELKAFATVFLAPGESRTVQMPITGKDLAYWDARIDGWAVEPGEYEVAVGASSRDLRLRTTVAVKGDDVAPPLTLASTLADALRHPTVGPALRRRIEEAVQGDQAASVFTPEVLLTVLSSFPLGRLSAFPISGLNASDIDQILGDAVDG